MTVAVSEQLFDILDETDDLLVINKSGDLVCHPTKGDAYSSLIGRLRLHFANQPEVKPSFINRLDRETSGVILIAKKPEIHATMQRLFEKGAAEKVYHAIVQGRPDSKEGMVDAPLGREPGAEVRLRQAVLEGGAASRTHWRLLESKGGYSVLEVRPETGRLHQIRVHLAHIGHSIVGDKLYGPDPRLYLEFIHSGWTPELERQLLVPRQMLHAIALRVTGAEQSWSWEAPIPWDMRGFLDKIGEQERPSGAIS